MASKTKSRAGRNSSIETPAIGKRMSKTASVNAIKDEERSTLAYKILSVPKTKKLMEADDVDDLERLVAEVLDLPDIRFNLKSAILLDYYVSALWWCKEQSYSADQTSAFFTVIDTLLTNIEKQQLDLAGNIQELKKMMAGIGCAESPEPEMAEEDGITNGNGSGAGNDGGLQSLFDVEQAKKIATYVHQGLFQHYRLYELLYGDNTDQHVIGTNLNIEMPKSADIPWPPPLCEAIPESIYQQLPQPQAPEITPVQPSEEVPANEEEELPTGVRVENAEQSPEEVTERPTEEEERALIAKLSPEQLRKVLDEVCSEMLTGLEVELAAKLRKKENEFIARINQIAVARSS